MNDENESTVAISTSIKTEDFKLHRVAFKMKLFEGQEAEYKKRHDELWPDLQQLLEASGISDYSIFLDESTNSLFGVLKARSLQALDNLPQSPVMQKWWQYMGDIMESNPDNSPVSIPLQEVFYLP
jgi:L-rhamnose mutarotase